MPRKRREIPWLQVRDEVYYVFWHDAAAGRTERLSLRTTDAMEAQRRYAAFLAEGHAAFERTPRALGISVGAALDDYWREHVQQHVIDKTRAENAIRHLKLWFKNTPLKEIDIPASRAYAEARRSGIVGGGARRKSGEGSDSTIRRELVVLQAAAYHARRWKRLEANDMPSIEMPRETSAGEAAWLTHAELDKAVAGARGRLLDFILLAYYTAARRASIERLTKFQVDLKANRINLRAPTENANQRRSKKRRPVVPIDPKLRPTVERLMLANPESPWLFGDPRDMYRPFAQHMTNLGLAKKSNPHILRHSRATHLLQDGVSIYDVAKLLGDTIATVERVYGHHCPEYLAQTIRGVKAGA